MLATQEAQVIPLILTINLLTDSPSSWVWLKWFVFTEDVRDDALLRSESKGNIQVDFHFFLQLVPYHPISVHPRSHGESIDVYYLDVIWCFPALGSAGKIKLRNFKSLCHFFIKSLFWLFRLSCKCFKEWGHEKFFSRWCNATCSIPSTWNVLSCHCKADKKELFMLQEWFLTDSLTKINLSFRKSDFRSETSQKTRQENVVLLLLDKISLIWINFAPLS